MYFFKYEDKENKEFLRYIFYSFKYFKRVTLRRKCLSFTYTFNIYDIYVNALLS